VNFDTDGKASLNKDGLYQFTCWMAQQEERLITKMIDRKMKSPFGEDDADNIALKEQAELPLLVQGTDANNRISLQPQWKSQYYRIGFGESSVDVRKHWVSQYWKGFQWIFDYYLGSAVDQEFVYAAGYPPTWCDLRDFFVFSKVDWSVRPILQPKEQLALVLPLASWNLLLKTPFRSLPHRLPQYWPASFHLETFGKRFGWECEPMIPMLTPERLRYEVSRMNTKV
jgi:5'-3' exonuclease